MNDFFYSIYRTSTGEVVGTHHYIGDTYQSIDDFPTIPDYSYCPQETNPSSQYILDSVVTTRPSMGVTLSKNTLVADEVDTVRVSNVLEGSNVYIDSTNPSHIVMDNTNILDITTDTVEDITVRVIKFPYKAFTEVINVT